MKENNVKILIISGEENYRILQELLKKTTIQLSFLPLNKNTNTFYANIYNRIMEYNDIVFIIDDKDDITSRINLDKILLFIPHTKKNIISIVIDNANLPSELTRYNKISINSNKELDFKKAARQLIYLLTAKKYINYKGNDIVKSKYLVIISIISTIISTIGTFVLSMPNNTLKETTYGLLMWLFIIFMNLYFATVCLILLSKKKNKEIKEEISETNFNKIKSAILMDNIISREKDILQEIKYPIDAIGRMLLNLDDIKEYYTWSQKQAKSSFKFAVIMCVIGIILITLPLLISFFLKLDMYISIITVFGGVIIEFISATALVIYKNSFEQLKHYHKALHEDERFLSSVNLLDKFKSQDQYELMLREIIQSEIKMNILSNTNNDFSNNIK